MNGPLVHAVAAAAGKHLIAQPHAPARALADHDDRAREIAIAVRAREHVRPGIVTHRVRGLFHQRGDLRANVRRGAIERVLEAGQAFEGERRALSHGASSVGVVRAA